MNNRGSDSRRVGNIYIALRRISRAIAAAQTREQLFDDACRAAIESGGYLFAWIGEPHSGGPAFVPAIIYAAQPNPPPLHGPTTDDKSARPISDATALAGGAREVCGEIDASSASAGWLAQARALGIHGAAAFALQSGGRACGFFCVYAAGNHPFQTHELDLLEHIAADISLAIEHLARDEDRRRADAIAQRLSAIVESTNDAVISKSADGTITSWNPAAERMFGYAAEEIIGRNILTLIPPDRIMEESDILARIARGERIVDRETIRVRKNGAPIPVSITVSPLKSADGAVIGASKIVRDVTERRIAAEALRAANANLEMRVNERTAELAIAKERAESADLLKSAFLATMSHELRTPLNSIIGFTGLILHGMAGPLNEEQNRQLGMVQGSARHLLSVINDVLDISKIEAGQLEVHAAAFDVRDAATKVVGSIEPMAARKALKLTLEVPDEPCMAVSDRRRIEQVLLNLLNNAVKFTERGEVALRIKLASQPPQIQFRVSDTGTGIKPEDMSTLFKPFRQIDSGLTRQHEGTGLGLSICSRLAELLRGQIHVESQYGVGSVFTFMIPVA